MKLESETAGAPKDRKAFSHELNTDAVATKDEWLTPPYIVKALGRFDLDPCQPVNPPWKLADAGFTCYENGLLKPWSGRVFCNPPYATASKWLGRCAEHGNATALVFARVETRMFHEHVWPRAIGVFFFKGRLTFLNIDGSAPKASGGAPSCLIAWDERNWQAIVHASETTKITGVPVRIRSKEFQI